MERVATDHLQDARLPIAQTTLGAALHYLPFGSGFGTFPLVYGIFEKPTDLCLVLMPIVRTMNSRRCS